MKKQNNIIPFAVFLLFAFTSCNDVLDIREGVLLAQDAFNTSDDAVQLVTGAYTPLMWEYQNNGGTFFPEWWIGDICSDDALKGGGSLSDMGLVYDMENFKTRSDNNVLLWFYRCQFVGVYRANLVFDIVPNMDPTVFEDELQNRILGEAYFLRALYYFRLVRVFGGVPLVDHVIKIQDEWKQPRASASEIFNLIYQDLELAIEYLPEKYTSPTDLGRATKGAARALLMKAYLSDTEETGQDERIENAKLQAEHIIESNVYSLYQKATGLSYETSGFPSTMVELKYNPYEYLFTIEGENSAESIFEIQYMSEGASDAWNGLGYTLGMLTPTMTRPVWGPEEGWGFNRPTQELYNEFEAGDSRRETAIYSPTTEQVALSDDNTNNVNVYLGNRYIALKYTMIRKDTTWIKTGHSTRGAINRKEIRYADVLLMYAEVCCKSKAPDYNRAKWALEEVRSRARIDEDGNVRNILPPFPNYRGYSDTPDDLYKAIQHERRVELAMEGHRWFDLKRWGILAEVMNNYRATTKPQIAQHMDEFVKGKHELFPIPLLERDLNSPMPQNPGYDGVPIQ